MPDLAAMLAAHRGIGYLVAPAGFGKTHLIAESVSFAGGRQLVLTHTYSGVNALRRKMRQLRVPGGAYTVDTIASWTLKLCLCYPAASGWTVKRPDQDEWTALYRACSNFLDAPFVRRIIRASYAGVFVDEYQDCSSEQHELVLKLSRDLPCRILGDPLQGIFDFAGEPVNWERDVSTAFECLGQLSTPHRWKRAGTNEMGQWLINIREALLGNQPIDLSQGLPLGVTFNPSSDLLRTQGNTCRYFRCDRGDTVIAIHKGSQEYKAKCHALAKNVAGKFSSIEEIEGKALFSFVQKIERAPSGGKRLKEVVAFAARCLTSVNINLPVTAIRGEHTNIRANTRNPPAARAANSYLDVPNSSTMAQVFRAIKETEGVAATRADLFNRMIGVLRKHVSHPELSLSESAEKYHAEFRHRGRPVGRRRLIGTTLLIKGLEFDHAIILDAASLSRKELYVALTRGAKSLTIISSGAILNPNE